MSCSVRLMPCQGMNTIGASSKSPPPAESCWKDLRSRPKWRTCAARKTRRCSVPPSCPIGSPPHQGSDHGLHGRDRDRLASAPLIRSDIGSAAVRYGVPEVIPGQPNKQTRIAGAGVRRDLHLGAQLRVLCEVAADRVQPVPDAVECADADLRGRTVKPLTIHDARPAAVVDYIIAQYVALRPRPESDPTFWRPPALRPVRTMMLLMILTPAAFGRTVIPGPSQFRMALLVTSLLSE